MRGHVHQGEADGLVPVLQGDEPGEGNRPKSRRVRRPSAVEPGVDESQGDVVTSFRVKTYEDASLGFNWRGWLSREYCLAIFRTDAPKDVVIIEDSLRFVHESRVVLPHPECKAKHDELDIEHWTVATIRAFPGVAPEHRRAVEQIGQKNRVVNVPVLEDITVGDIR